jgi:hypothetical protein
MVAIARLIDAPMRVMVALARVMRAPTGMIEHLARAIIARARAIDTPALHRAHAHVFSRAGRTAPS